MTALASPCEQAHFAAVPSKPRGLYRLVLVLVWLGTAASGVVFAEPAPVDLSLILLIGLLPLAGLVTFSQPLLVYAALWLLVTAGGCIGAMSAFDFAVAGKQVLTTFYLSLASVALAAFFQCDPARHVRLVLNAYLLAAVIATLAALIGYFDIIPSFTELLTEFGRARGTFKDPNVYGAFVVPALVYALHLGFTKRRLTATLALAVTAFLLLGVLLSFSRGAWSNAAVSLGLFCFLSFATSRSNIARVRIIGLFWVSAISGVAVLWLAIQSPAVSALLTERAQVEQSYDTLPNGRFAGHEIAKALIASHPQGIGPLQFGGNYHQEDVHEVYLNVLLGHGWLGGSAYILVVALTLIIGFVAALRRGPAQGMLLVALSAFAGAVGEGFVVDTDHWRHFFLLMSVIWGIYLGAKPNPPGAAAGGPPIVRQGRRRPWTAWPDDDLPLKSRSTWLSSASSRQQVADRSGRCSHSGHLDAYQRQAGLRSGAICPRRMRLVR